MLDFLIRKRVLYSLTYFLILNCVWLLLILLTAVYYTIDIIIKKLVAIRCCKPFKKLPVFCGNLKAFRMTYLSQRTETFFEILKNSVELGKSWVLVFLLHQKNQKKKVCLIFLHLLWIDFYFWTIECVILPKILMN